MLLTVAGLILMSIPLFLVLFFKNRFKGFLTVIFGLTTFHLFLSVFTQALHIFSYKTIIITHFIVASAVLMTLFIKKYQLKTSSFNFNWLAVLAFLVIGFQFWSVHYSYTGEISTINGYQEVANNSYTYPYYSDEWVGISLINYSIENKTLPLANPLWPDSRFINPTFPFFSFFSEIFLLLQLDPLTTYPIFAIVSGTLICFLSYLILRRLNAGLPIALFAVLSIPYIVNSANLPGLWYFIPLIMGLILFLSGLLSLVSDYRRFAFLYSILSVIFYPPIIVFSLPIILASCLKHKKLENKKEIWLILSSLILVFTIASAFIFGNSGLSSIKNSIMSLVFRDNLQNGIPKFNIFTIIPVWLSLFAVVGLFIQFKAKKYLLICLGTIGLMFWAIYSGTQKVLIIEYQRVIVITSIVVAILAGLGLRYIKDLFCEKYRACHKISDFNLATIVLAIFMVASFFYTKHTDWKKLVMQIYSGENKIEISPASPANMYLSSDDLKLFENIKGQKFITLPWKGLVVGAATGNYPLESKASTITNRFFSYNDFMSADCGAKTRIAEKSKIAYVYSSPFVCQHFKKQGESDEGLILYNFLN